jgi:hypothetical protein
MPAQKGLLPACLIAILVGCVDSSVNVGSSVTLAPTLLFPRGLLDNVTTLTLNVYDTVNGAGASTGVDCNVMTGIATGVTSGTTPIATQNLGATSCLNGAKFCGTIQIPESPTDRVFYAVGTAGAQTVANGCARVTVNQPSLPLTIKMVHYVAPNQCGNGVVEPGETCDPPSGQMDPACNASSCQTIEELLSVGSAATFTVNGKPGDKTNPNFLWPGNGEFLAFFNDKSPSTLQVTMRVLDSSLGPTGTHGPAVQSASFFLPPGTGTGFPPPATANDNENPAAAAFGGKYYVAFDGDSAGTFDIHLRSMDTSLTADQAPPSCIVNGNGGEPGRQSLPAISAGSSVLYVAWQDDQGNISGRTYPPGTPCSAAPGTQQVLSTGTGNAAVQLAYTGAGWVAVWQSGPSVKMRPIGMDGTPTATEQVVNDTTHQGTQDHPSIASFGDGRFAIAWNDHGANGPGTVVVQRYDATGAPIASDQDTKVNNLTSVNELSPVIVASGAASGFYVLAWVDSGAPNHVRARLLAGTGGATADNSAYLFNTITGQADEFQVSTVDGRPRANPTIAVGGQSYIAFGWEDKTSDANAGIIARRFPSGM